MKFSFHYFTEASPGYNFFDHFIITIITAILVYRYNFSFFFCNLYQFLSFFNCNCKRFFNDNMFSSLQNFFRVFVMGIVRRIYNYKFYIFISQ